MCLHLFDCITCSLQFELPNSLFFGQLSQIHPLSRAMNWSTPYCKGYVLVSEWIRLGSWTKKKESTGWRQNYYLLKILDQIRLLFWCLKRRFRREKVSCRDDLAAWSVNTANLVGQDGTTYMNMYDWTVLLLLQLSYHLYQSNYIIIIIIYFSFMIFNETRPTL